MIPIENKITESMDLGEILFKRNATAIGMFWYFKYTITGIPIIKVLIPITVNDVAGAPTSESEPKMPRSAAPATKPNNNESNTMPKAILILFLFSKVINYAWFSG